jgi:hypothetical protein
MALSVPEPPGLVGTGVVAVSITDSAMPLVTLSAFA